MLFRHPDPAMVSALENPLLSRMDEVYLWGGSHTVRQSGKTTSSVRNTRVRKNGNLRRAFIRPKIHNSG